MRVISVVDSIDYASNNCFQHQLMSTLKKFGVETISLNDMMSMSDVTGLGIISCLRQRTLAKNASQIAKKISRIPVVVYDQDPWEAFRDDGTYKGSYDLIMKSLNVRTFAVTSKWWSTFVNSKGFPCQFVRMWVLPEYCNLTKNHVDRSTKVGFIGSVHAHRKEFFDRLSEHDINVKILPSTSNYKAFLDKLQDISVFVHCEDLPLIIDDQHANIGTGLWVKDIEAASQGCMTLRNYADGAQTYLSNVPAAMTYTSVNDAVATINRLLSLPPETLDDTALESINNIIDANAWDDTASSLITSMMCH